MKKNLTKPVIAVLLGALTFSSCIGSFGLTNSVLNWNKRATDTKFVNEIIFVLISPAYAVCAFADLLVLNSIESHVCHQDIEEWLRDYRPRW